MIRNIYALRRIVAEISRYIGYSVSQCFTQEKDSISIELSNEEESQYLHFAADGKNDALYLRHNFARSRANSSDLFSSLEGEVLQSASVLSNNRIIKLQFIHSTVYCILYGGLKSNVIAVNRKGKIFDAFRDKQTLLGQEYNPENNPARSFDDFGQDIEIVRALGSSDYLIGSIYARDILKRLSINPKATIAELSAEEIETIKAETEKYIRKLESADRFYVLKNGEKALFSLLPLKEYPEIMEIFDSVSQAVKRTSSYNFRVSLFLPLYKQLENRLTKKQRKLKNTLDAFKETIYTERIEKYKYFGDLLAATPIPNKTNGDKIILLGWSGEDVEIALDEKKTLIQNSLKYYEKSKDTRAELKVRNARQPKILSELAQTEAALEDLHECNNQKKLEQLYSRFGKELGINYQDNKMDREDKFKKFELDDGFMLYVGKNAANNDELTVKFAKPNDIWLHARGASGSHAVIRVEKGQKPPAKRVIEQAAAICAYFSGQKNSKYAAVAYTEKKYVRKPKGAAVGAVTMAREKVVMVEPKQNLNDVEIN